MDVKNILIFDFYSKRGGLYKTLYHKLISWSSGKHMYIFKNLLDDIIKDHEKVYTHKEHTVEECMEDDPHMVKDEEINYGEEDANDGYNNDNDNDNDNERYIGDGGQDSDQDQDVDDTHYERHLAYREQYCENNPFSED